jgi:hypothetical protein
MAIGTGIGKGRAARHGIGRIHLYIPNIHNIHCRSCSAGLAASL